MTDIRLDESARVGGPRDVADVAWLAATAIEAIADQRGGELWTLREARSIPADESVATAIADENQLVLIGLLDDVAVGYAMARLETLPDSTILAVIDDLYVLPEGRQVGVGGEMMERLMAWARENGCRGIDAAALPGDRHTKNFFESNGLVARAILVHHALSDPNS